jgi:FkbM family methyltransferase
MYNRRNFTFRYHKSFSENIVKLLKQIIYDFLIRRHQTFSTALFNSGYISKNYLLHRAWEPEIVSYIKHVAKESSLNTFIDIGANIGVSSFQVIDSFVNLILVEPIPLCAQMCEYNLASHPEFSKKNVLILNSAIAETNTSLDIKINLEDLGSTSLAKEPLQTDLKDTKEFRSRNITVSTIDGTALANKIINHCNLKDKPFDALIKIDVEGYESIVLKEVLKIHNQINLKYLIIEVMNHDKLDECLKLLRMQSDYRIFSFRYSARGSRYRNMLSLIFGSTVTLSNSLPKSFPADVIFQRL